MKNTRSMPLRFTFKPRWFPPPPSLISLPESSLPDCWSRVTRTIGQDCRHLGILKCACVSHSACVCVRRVNVACVCSCVLRLRLRRTCEPALNTESFAGNKDKLPSRFKYLNQPVLTLVWVRLYLLFISY